MRLQWRVLRIGHVLTGNICSTPPGWRRPSRWRNLEGIPLREPIPSSRRDMSLPFGLWGGSSPSDTVNTRVSHATVLQLRREGFSLSSDETTCTQINYWWLTAHARTQALPRLLVLDRERPEATSSWRVLWNPPPPTVHGITSSAGADLWVNGLYCK